MPSEIPPTPGTATEGGWVDLFELSRYRGRRRRVFGPVRWIAMRSREPGWGVSIDSLIVGPAAWLRLFSSKEPERGGKWFAPREAVQDLLDLRVGDDLDSLAVLNGPPSAGDSGYEAFVAQRRQVPAPEV